MVVLIEEILKEELENSLRMKKEYEEALKGSSKGCLAERKIGNQKYCYLVKRIGKKVRYNYIGKISQAEKNQYELAKVLRAKYRKALTQAKKQIKFLKRALRVKV